MVCVSSSLPVSQVSQSLLSKLRPLLWHIRDTSIYKYNNNYNKNYNKNQQ